MGSIIDIALVGIGVLMALTTIVIVIRNYRIADSNQILVVTGKVSGNKSAKTIHGGATFVWPIFQQYTYLDLAPIQIDIDLKNALSKQNIRINVPSTFTIAISTDSEIMGAAAERLLNRSNESIATMAKDIIFGQLRATIADMTIEEINKDRDKFITSVRSNVEGEMKKIGLIVINVNITDITDESGYLEALGQKAASEAINTAKVDVAQKERDGEIGSAEAKKEERISVAAANSEAVKGENTAQETIADSNAQLKVKQEEARKLEVSATLVNKAKAEKEGYDANKIAEEARAEQEKARLKAEEVVPAEIEKEKVIIAAKAEKEQEVLSGQAEGEAEKAKQEGIAAGIQAILDAKAEGFKNIIASAGSAEAAVQLMIVDQLPELARIQVEAIKNIKIDKITVWEQGGSDGKGGSTQNFLQSMAGFVPPMQEMLNNSGMALPDWIAKDLDSKEGSVSEEIIEEDQEIEISEEEKKED